MLRTPFGTISVLIDNIEIQYVCVKLPVGGYSYREVTARYAIPVFLEPDGEEHTIDCRLVDIPGGVYGEPDSGEAIECMTFDNEDESIRLSIACWGETGGTIEYPDRGYDYDTVTLSDGMSHIMTPATKTSKYVFGISWKEGNITALDEDTWFGAIPIGFTYYCINPEIGTITYEVLLSVFKFGAFVDETRFYFEDDPLEEEHYIGYLPEFEKTYWAGYCDIEDGCEFETSEELFEAKIYNGKSLKDRWDTVVLLGIGGLAVEDYFYSIPEVRHLFTEGAYHSRNAFTT